MKISVVIPCLNAAATIDQQLEALTHQSPAPWEVIVADNGSIDATLDIVKQYSDRLPQLKIVDASGNQGAGYARNIGVRAATGDYIAFCDADDVVAPAWLRALEHAFANHSFLACRFDFEQLNPGGQNGVQDQGLQHFRIPFLPFAGAGGLAIQRQLYERVGGFDENFTHLEDAEFCIRAQLTGLELVFVPEAVIYIRSSLATPKGFFEARWSTFRKAFAWGNGLGKIHRKYKEKGMQFHGTVPRLVLLSLWILRSLVDVKNINCFWRIGWHMGALHALLQQPTPQISVTTMSQQIHQG
jgi:glycosyltransferase involved in cell wall biosynthesis